jgi:4-amino-4-deoxy-L-arabinose transferase-like glycosyltransferase
MQRSHPRPFTRRATVLAAVLAAAVAGRSLATATRVEGWWPSLLSRFDAIEAIVLVLGVVFVALPSARAAAQGRSASLWRGIWPLVWRTYLVWWTALAVSIAAGNTILSPARFVSHALFFRHPGSAGPPPDLAIGWVLSVLLTVGVLLPLWRRAVGVAAERRGGLLAGELSLAVTLAGVGLVVRVVGTFVVDPHPYGPLSLVVGQFHLVGAGLAVAALLAHRHAVSATIVRGAAGAIAVGAILTVALLDGGLPTTDSSRILQVLASATIAIGVAVLLATLPSRRTTNVWWHRVGFVGPATLVMVGPSLALIARQYRERIEFHPDGWLLDGSMLAPFIWTMCVAVALALAVRILAETPVAGLLRDRRSPTPYWAAWVAGIAAGGFLWRIVTLLTVAPERTDGGDPLFYHATANIIAQGRGFPEPLNWIAFARSIPSALHGPLYPVYLSIWSRLGATAYFDQKMASILVGTATIVVAALLARRVAGRGAGLAAAALVGLYPHLWLIDGVMFPEGLMVLLCGLVVLAAYRWRDTHALSMALSMGGLIGLAALTRGEGLFLSVLLVVPWILGDKRLTWKRRIRDLVLAGVACVVVLAPWMLYNLPRFEVFVPLSTNGNELHVYSNCDDVYSGKFLGFWAFECQERIRRESGEPEGDEAEKAVYWRHVGFDYARDNADQLPKVLAARVLRQWDLLRPFDNARFAAIEGRNVGAAQAGLAMYWAMIPFAAYGIVRVRRRKVPVWPLLSLAAMVTITAAYAYGTTRFRAPAELVLCVLAGAGLAPVLARGWRRLAPDGRPHPIGGRDAFVVGGPGLRNVRAGLRRRSTVGAVAVLVAVIVAPLRGLYLAIGSTMEEGFMLVFPERVLKGDVPNVDFLHLYGPGSLDVLAAAYWTFGTSLEVERTVGLLQHLGIIAAIWTLTRAWGRGIALVSALVCTLIVLTPIGLTALAWNGGVAFGLWSVVFALRARHSARPARWWLGAGLLGGLALSYRPDLAVAVVLGLGWLLWCERARWKSLVLGGVIGLLPMWVHFVVAGPQAAIQGMLLDPVFELRPGRELPMPPSWNRVEGALQVIGENVAPWWGLPAPRASQQLFLWFVALPIAAFGVLAIAIVAHRRGPLPRTRVLVAAALFGVGLLPQALQRPDSAHLAWVSMVTFALVPVAVLEVIARRRGTWTPIARTAGIGAAMAVTLLVLAPFYTYRPYLFHVRQSVGDAPVGLVVSRGDRWFPIGDLRTSIATQEVIDDLDRLSTPGQRLLVGPVDLRQTAYSDVFFHHLFPDLDPATYYIEMDPGLANTVGSSLPDDVRSADWLILTRFWSGWIEPNTSIVFGPDDANVVVENEFCLRGSYQRDLIRLYERCEGGGAPGPYEGPYDPTVDYAVEVRVPVPPRSDGTFPPGSPAAP